MKCTCWLGIPNASMGSSSDRENCVVHGHIAEAIKLLQWLDACGGLGMDKHSRIKAMAEDLGTLLKPKTYVSNPFQGDREVKLFRVSGWEEDKDLYHLGYVTITKQDLIMGNEILAAQVIAARIYNRHGSSLFVKEIAHFTDTED